MTTNDKLREALEMIAKTGPDARQCRNIAVAALAASKPEPQAQAAEPLDRAFGATYLNTDGVLSCGVANGSIFVNGSLVARNASVYVPHGSSYRFEEDGSGKSALAVYRMPEPQAQAGEPMRIKMLLKQIEILDSVIAKKDAALKACVEALESYSKSPYVKKQHPKRHAAGNAAIAQAKEARK